MVEHAVSGRLEQIGLRRPLRRQRLPPPPQLEHHVLYDLLGYRTVAQHPFGRPDERPVPRAKDRVERLRVPLPESIEKLAVREVRQVEAGPMDWDRAGSICSPQEGSF